MNSKNIKTSSPQRLLLKLSDKVYIGINMLLY